MRSESRVIRAGFAALVVHSYRRSNDSVKSQLSDSNYARVAFESSWRKHIRSPRHLQSRTQVRLGIEALNAVGLGVSVGVLDSKALEDRGPYLALTANDR